jgi:hypothetical protein
MDFVELEQILQGKQQKGPYLGNQDILQPLRIVIDGIRSGSLDSIKYQFKIASMHEMIHLAFGFEQHLQVQSALIAILLSEGDAESIPILLRLVKRASVFGID